MANTGHIVIGGIRANTTDTGKTILTHISIVPVLCDIGKQWRPRSDATESQNAASDQGLHHLLTECYYTEI